MAIGRITGQMLSANLARSGTDLTFETNLLALDVTNSRIGIGTASPATTLHVSATDALRLPSGNTAQRPGTPANGDIRYNSDTGAVEGYAGGWLKMTGGTTLADADSDTQIEVERTADEDQIHFQVGGTDAAHIRSNGNIELNNLQIADTTISTLSTNGDLTLTPNGTGKVIVTDGTTLQTNTADINGGAIDGTVIGANSAAAGTFTTIGTSGNVTIGGDLTVNGTTTTVSTTNTVVSDTLLELGNGTTGAPANDAGIVIERGDSNNAFIGFDESADKFIVGTGTFTGASTGNLTITTGTLVANLEATTATVGGSNVTTTDNTQTLTNKTFDANGTGNSISNIDFADFTSGVILDEDNMASDSATNLATQQSIKAYVDSSISTAENNDTTITDGNSSVVVADTGSGTITATVDGATVATFQPGDLALPNNVGLLFGTGGEKIESNGTDLTITSTGALQLTVTGTTTVSGALTVTGDLTVNGTTTTVNSTNTTLDDNLLELNSGAASNANDSGIIIERGSTGDNAIFMWDESADKFTLGTTTATASSTGNITITTGTLVASTFEGNLTGAVTGNADTATEATNVTITANNTANETVYLTFVDGATGTQGLETDTGLSYNPSTNVLSTTASQAQYADLAEKYTTDQEYEVGTVVMVNTSDVSEVTAANTGNIAVGVISGAPAYLMNADSEGQAVALKGRVPVKVAGAVSKGQAVYVDDNGVATASNTGSDMVGIALESNGDSGVKLVECILKV